MCRWSPSIRPTPRIMTTRSMPSRTATAKNAGGHIVYRRHRRRRRLCAAGHRARPRGVPARQFGLFPRPRRADAARAHFERSLLAEGGRQPPCPRRAHGDRRRRPQEAATASTASCSARPPSSATSRRRRPSTASPTTRPARSSTPILKPLWARLWRHGQGPRPSRPARPRPARAQDHPRRQGHGRRHPRARATRCPPADRGNDDRRQCRGGRNAGEAP